VAPQPVSSPTRRFVVTKIDAGVETNIAVGTLLPSGYTTDAPQRSIVFDTTLPAMLAANPGVTIRVYSPSNGGAHVDGDCVWDSRVSS